MVLRFPNVDVLQLAMTSDVIGQSVQCAPARFAADDDKGVLIDPSTAINRTMLNELKKLGVERKRKDTKADFRPIVSWHQALPLVPVPDNVDTIGKTEVLFEIDGEQYLPVIVSEMLRLGNDRQSFRYVGENGAAKTLLRVTAPPYYTMLRALDRAADVESNPDAALTAFYQQSSRVWVEVGYRHPLGDRLVPPAGKWLLISPNHHWRFLKEGAFRDVYEVLDFVLPEASEDFVDQEPKERIRVPLELTGGSSQEAAELWVLSQNAMAQVEQLIGRSDDQLISRLAFAVAEPSGNSTGGNPEETGPTVIVRARPSKNLPPVLVLDGVACRTYLKIPNLFLPVGTRLHPPLRRDAVARLLAAPSFIDGSRPDPNPARQSDRITWLMPGEGGKFTPQSIPDGAFRPLSDWIDYVVDHEAKPLEAWIASHRFDFEHFVCKDDGEKRKPGPPKKPAVKEPGQSKASSPPADTSATSGKNRRGSKRGRKGDALEFIESPAEQPKHDELKLRLRELENDFQASTEPLDSPVRAAIWKEMALTNAALRHRHDSTICWVNSIWSQTDVDEDSATAWLRCEQHCSTVGKLTLSTLDELMGGRAVRSAEPSLVAAYLVWSASRDETPPAITQRLGELIQFLRRQESFLPVRTAWLSWCALYKMSGNDVLLLARARDRLLERLFNQGLAPEFDMAAFMRTGGIGDGDRFRVLRAQVIQLHAKVKDWIIEPSISSDPQTKAYADLVFAYAFARLGETARCNEILEAIGPKLNRSDVIHKWVLNAYGVRIQQSLAGQTTQGHLPDELIQTLELMDRMDRYKLDRLRERSRILEPHVQIDPFTNYHQRFADELSRELAQLQKIVDRDELSTRITQLVNLHDGDEQSVRVLPTVLQLAPRIGEKFAAGLLAKVPAAIDHCRQSMEKARVLQRALHIAAHYGRVDLVQSFVVDLRQALPKIVSDYLEIDSQMKPENKERIEATESLLAQSFRGLRKLGMRTEIGHLYGSVAELVEASFGKSKSKQRRSGGGDGSRAQRLLLCVAGGWYYFGEQESARKIVEKVRVVLRTGDLPNNEQRSLTCAYLNAVSQAPVDEALERVQEIFALNKKGEPELPKIGDNMATCSHFSISQLDVVEAAVMSLISDDFSLSAGARRWLDEDEFLVRSRIHRDMREALTH